ncbi:MAG: chitobiase/beta-hexosaminidase C-terminal domain-containing protein [Eubacterium sp.]|nr:chitobiase/beta-hexosaminidase C-terminal domain-containing protein [Eubacterium sp.]
MKGKFCFGIVLLLVLLPILSGCGSKGLETKISLESGEYTGEQTVELSNSKGAEIYYTLNGEDPKGDAGLKYEKPLKINYDTTLKAYSRDGGSKGSVAEATYTIKEEKAVVLTEEERAFLANVTGTYQNGSDEYIINGNRTLEWKNSTGSGKAEYTITLPEDGDGFKGTLHYKDGDKDASLVIDCMPPGDNAIFINDVSYDYMG